MVEMKRLILNGGVAFLSKTVMDQVCERCLEDSTSNQYIKLGMGNLVRNVTYQVMTEGSTKVSPRQCLRGIAMDVTSDVIFEKVCERLGGWTGIVAGLVVGYGASEAVGALWDLFDPKQKKTEDDSDPRTNNDADEDTSENVWDDAALERELD